MYYKVVEYFGPGHPQWHEFADSHWIGSLMSFDSIDGILCPDLFSPTTDEDWRHCVQEDHKTSLITNRDYALQIWRAHPGSRLVGVKESADCDAEQSLLGYDILDGYNGVSLVTNWDPASSNHPLRNFAVTSNGLIARYDRASVAAASLRHAHAADSHAAGATVWAVFSVGV